MIETEALLALAARHTDALTIVGLRILSDDLWHLRDELVLKLEVLVPPGQAVRYYWKYHGRRVHNPRGDVVLCGAHALARTRVNSLGRNRRAEQSQTAEGLMLHITPAGKRLLAFMDRMDREGDIDG